MENRKFERTILFDDVVCFEDYKSSITDRQEIEGVVSYSHPSKDFGQLPLLNIQWSNGDRTILQPASYEFMLITHIAAKENSISFSIMRVIAEVHEIFDIHDAASFKKEMKKLEKAFKSASMRTLLKDMTPMQIVFDQFEYKEKVVKYLFGVGAIFMDYAARIDHIAYNCTLTVPEKDVGAFLDDWALYISASRIPLNFNWIFYHKPTDTDSLGYEYDPSLDSPWDDYGLDDCLEELSI